MITRLCAFDFDATLINSPEKEAGQAEWSEKMGVPFKYQGWWGRPESLDLNVFDIKPFPKVLSILNKDVSTPATYVIVLTSRQEKLRPLVQAVLDVNNIHVDKLDMQRGARTKGQKILDYASKLPDLREINVYDDRDTDIISYEGIRSSLPEGIKFNIYIANKGELTLDENKLLSIIREEIEKFNVETLNAPITIFHGADIENIKSLIKNPRILPPEEKRTLPSNTGGYLIGLSTSMDIDKARKYSNGFGHSKVLAMQLLSGAKVIKIDTDGNGIDNIFTGDDLENYQKEGVDAIIELDDNAENEIRILNSNYLKVIGIV